METTDAATRRRPGRPPSGEEYVRVCVLLRKEQVEWLNEYLAKRPRKKGLNSSSAIIRGLIDSVFAKR